RPAEVLRLLLERTEHGRPGLLPPDRLHDVDAELRGVPADQRLRIPGAEEHAADSQDPFHAPSRFHGGRWRATGAGGRWPMVAHAVPCRPIRRWCPRSAAGATPAAPHKHPSRNAAGDGTEGAVT